MTVEQASGNESILKCRDVILALRPHVKEDEFLSLVWRMQADGVRIFFIEDKGRAVSACVFRMNYYFARGLNVYIDDLSTLQEFRGKGFATALLEAVKKFAIENNCESIHLDSGHHRYDAHRLYLNYGFKITSHHFVMDLRKM